ncbi:MAG: hypothetical protein K9K81_10965 [Desulfobacteraceae bacterium]|nr:hypothetical protein [Desulfobacteraceae bacterium]
MRADAGKIIAGLSGVILLAILMLPGKCPAASPGNFLALFPDAPGGVSSFMTLYTERQVNDFARQRERRPEIDSQGEERHYSEIRQSENTFSFDGGKAGAAFGRVPLLYVIAGYGQAEVDFSFTDELTENKEEYSRQAMFENDGFPVFGGGIAAMMFDATVFENSRFSIGGDLQYRWLDFSAEKGALSYTSTLHEIQLSIAASLEDLQWRPMDLLKLKLSPYGGAKIMHFIGEETFADPANTDAHGNPDPIYYSEDLEPGNHVTFFLGTNIEITGPLFLGLETRFGDDEGYAVQLGCNF